MFTWGFFVICLFAIAAATIIFWLIETKLFNEDPTLKKWSRNIIALICVILLIIFIFNIVGGHVNLNTPIVR